jgi:hypothetical protein
MASSQSPITVTFPAAGDLSAKQHYIMELQSDGQVDAANAATDVPLGILLNDPSVENEEALVAIGGIVKVSADAAISVGDLVGPSADGQAVAKTADADHVIGIALQAAGAAGDLIEILIRPMQRAS